MQCERSNADELDWSRGKQRLPDWMIERYGYAKARRIGVVAMIGGKDKTTLRNGTPPPFRDLLLSIARMSSVVDVSHLGRVRITYRVSPQK